MAGKLHNEFYTHISTKCSSSPLASPWIGMYKASWSTETKSQTHMQQTDHACTFASRTAKLNSRPKTVFQVPRNYQEACDACMSFV